MPLREKVVVVNRWCVLLTFEAENLSPHPIIFEGDSAEQDAVWYAELMADGTHIREVEVFRSYGFYKGGGRDE